MLLKLRSYQEECLHSIHDHYKQGINRQLIHMATGAGKTVIFANLIAQKNCKTLVLAHTCELLDQAKEKINMINPELEVGIVNAGNKEYDHQVIISSIQSARQPDTLEHLKKQQFTLCIYDEAHRAGADSSRLVLSTLGFLSNSSEKLLAAFTATPFRNGSKGLGAVFQKVVYRKSVKDLINLGYLCKPVGIKIKTDLDLSSVQTEDGDFKTESLASYMDTPQITQLIIDSYFEYASDRHTVAFCVNVDHAYNLANAFKRHGIAAEAIHGGTPSNERAALLERFKNGSIDVLTNCQILTEGVDIPLISCVLIARPTQSKGLYQQMAGRGLRNFPNKKNCLILDFGAKSHSLCSTAALLDDVEEAQKKEKPKSEIPEFAKKLPPTINKKLRAAIVAFDPIGDEFAWVQDGQSFSLKATDDKILKIFPTAEGRFSVMFFESRNSYRIIAENLMFDYAFGTAEEFAKSNRELFVFSDLEAPWRSLPISDKQRSLFNSYGYRAGIEDLNRGQAALIISSGVLNKKTARL